MKINVFYDDTTILDVFAKDLIPETDAFKLLNIEIVEDHNLRVTLRNDGLLPRNLVDGLNYNLEMEDWRGDKNHAMGTANITDRGLNGVLEAGFSLRLVPRVIDKTGGTGVLMLEPAPVTEAAKESEPERIAGKFKRGEITENQALELIKHWAQYRLMIEDDVREADTERELEDEEYEDLSHHSWTGVHDEESVEQ